jgi:hypothetical protein
MQEHMGFMEDEVALIHDSSIVSVFPCELILH